ncbi:MAG: hypothetical protein ABR568_22525 [Pyrinomonadaceae bacterium]
MVRIPMMPKGVEDMNAMVRVFAVDIVRIPMMPKGVEHIFSLHQQRA